MHIAIIEKIGAAVSGVKEYKARPGNFQFACNAAYHYAKRNKAARMIVVPGNSYGSKVYHIARETDSLAKYQPGGATESVVGIVSEFGEVFKGVASRNPFPEL